MRHVACALWAMGRKPLLRAAPRGLNLICYHPVSEKGQYGDREVRTRKVGDTCEHSFKWQGMHCPPRTSRPTGTQAVALAHKTVAECQIRCNSSEADWSLVRA